LSVRQLAETTLQLLGMRKRILAVPSGLLRSLTKLAVALSIPLPYNPKLVPYVTRYWFADASKATRDLGVSFRPARDTLASVVDWLIASGHIDVPGPRRASAESTSGVAGFANSN
jgi:hypothetical protein